MQIHELNVFNGTLADTDYLAIDSGYDTSKIPATKLLKDPMDAIDALKRQKVNYPLDGSGNPLYGNPGQVLRTKGNNKTEWADVGAPTDAQAAAAIAAWLNDHPEATTTVQDGSITEAKLNSSLKDELLIYVSSLAELLAALSSGRRLIAFKEGTTITVSHSITIPKGTTLIGNGLKIIRAVGHEGKILVVKEECNISGIYFDGNRSEMVAPSWASTSEMTLEGFCNVSDCIFEHGNECIIAYGDCNRITHCKFTDCGGNAIHFSGGKYTVVDGCFVRGANKRSGMGHENGCIIWSSECAYVTCVNNYCEDGLSGFGRIGSIHAGYAKIIGNTVVNCGAACEVGNTASDTQPARDILIANNLFVNSVHIKLWKTPTITCDIGRVSIIGNDFIETQIHGDRFTNLVISNNNLRGKAALIHLERCVSTVVSNNVINNTANATRTLFFYACINLVISNNYIRGGQEAVFGNASINVSVEGNHVSAYCPAASDLAISVVTDIIFKNNIVASYGKGIDAGTGCQVIGNQFWLVSAGNAIRTWGGTVKCIVALNMTNQSFSLANSADAQYLGNISGATENVFTTATLNLTNITSDGITNPVLGDDYICKLTAAAGYSLPNTISVSVNDQTLNASEFAYDSRTGEVEIYGIVGPVIITAAGLS